MANFASLLIMLYAIACGAPQADPPDHLEVIGTHGAQIGIVDVLDVKGGNILLSLGTDNRIVAWDLETKKPAWTLKRVSWSPQRALSISPDQSLLAAPEIASTNVRLVDIKTGKVIRRFSKHSHNVDSTAFSPDGNDFACGVHDGHVNIWNLKTGKRQHLFRAQEDQLFAIAFSQDGRMLATGGVGGAVRIWDSQTWKSQAILTAEHDGQKDYFSGIEFSPDGQHVIASGRYNLYAWNLKTKQRTELGRNSATFFIRQDSFNPTGQELVGADIKQEKRSGARIWRLTNFEENSVLSEAGRQCLAACFDSSGRYVATVSVISPPALDGLIDVKSRGGRYIAKKVVVDDRQKEQEKPIRVTVWIANTKKIEISIDMNAGAIMSLRFDQTGKRLIFGDNDGKVRVWTWEKE